MKIKLKNDCGTVRANKIVDATINPITDIAFFYDEYGTIWNTDKTNYELVDEEMNHQNYGCTSTTTTAYDNAITTIRGLLGQDIKSIEFK